MILSNNYYNLGDGTTENRGNDSDEMGNNLSAVDLGTDFVPIAVEAGGWHVCSMSESKAVKCWGQFMLSLLIKIYCLVMSLQFTGRNDYGQLGIDCQWTEQFGDDLPALDFSDGFNPKLMALGGYHSCFVSTNGSMICFGDNQYGQVLLRSMLVDVDLFSLYFLQLGYGDTVGRGGCGTDYEDISDLSAVDLGSNFQIAQIQMMHDHGCALSTSDELKCWGKQSVSVYDVHVVSVSLCP